MHIICVYIYIQSHSRHIVHLIYILNCRHFQQFPVSSSDELPSPPMAIGIFTIFTIRRHSSCYVCWCINPWLPQVNIQKDVKDPWFPQENAPQILGFPHQCQFIGGYLKLTSPQTVVQQIRSQLNYMQGASSCSSIYPLLTPVHLARKQTQQQALGGPFLKQPGALNHKHMIYPLVL